ncbi:hypothetical protein EJ110_NYTH48045 [Nymphaea thermarum]|nr:hypothetical protein EJ110_NYTH48045 [Nymphaea thermarum]
MPLQVYLTNECEERQHSTILTFTDLSVKEAVEGKDESRWVWRDVKGIVDSCDVVLSQGDDVISWKEDGKAIRSRRQEEEVTTPRAVGNSLVRHRQRPRTTGDAQPVHPQWQWPCRDALALVSDGGDVMTNLGTEIPHSIPIYLFIGAKLESVTFYLVYLFLAAFFLDVMASSSNNGEFDQETTNTFRHSGGDNQQENNSNTLNVTTQLLNESNYLSWAKAARLFLSGGKGRLGYITENIRQPSSTDSRKWERKRRSVEVWSRAAINKKITKRAKAPSTVDVGILPNHGSSSLPNKTPTVDEAACHNRVESRRGE